MKPKSSTSFTLLEIVIAMLILSLVVAGLFGLFVNSTKFIVESQHRLQAMNYARMVAEQLKVYVSADPDTPAGAGAALAEGLEKAPSTIGLDDSITFGGVPMSCKYDVDEDINILGSLTDLDKVTITVTWTEP